MKTLKIASLAAALGLLLACDGLFNIGNPNIVIGNPAQPSVTTAGCEVSSVVAQAEATTVTAGGAAVRLDATPYGLPAGTPLGDNCTSTLSPTWTTPSPCTLEGSGYNPYIRALPGISPGKTCTTFATVGGRQSNQVTLTVQ